MLDNKDLKLLYYLDKNARIPLAELAKKVRMSKQNLNYRLKKLEENKVILRYTPIIDMHKLGLLSYRVYFRYKKVNAPLEKEILSFFKQLPETIWFVSLSGSWDLEVVFGARNFIHLSNILKKVHEKIGKYISKTDISMSVVNYHLSREYLIQEKRSEFKPKYYGFEPEREKIDDLDRKILRVLSKDCRQNASQIGEQVGATYHTVKSRIKNLEKKGIIQGYRILFDFRIVGREYYKILVNLDNINKQTQENLYSFLSTNNAVVYLIEVLGRWNLEIEIEAENNNQTIQLLKSLRNKFPNVISDYEILNVLEEHKLNYLPE